MIEARVAKCAKRKQKKRRTVRRRWQGGRGRRRQDEVEVDGLRVFRLLHQQKPVGGGKKRAVMRAAAVDTLGRKHSSSHLAAHSSSSNPHIFTNIITLTLTLEGLQHGGVSGAQPGGVASQNSQQVVGGIAEEQIRLAVVC